MPHLRTVHNLKTGRKSDQKIHESPAPGFFFPAQIHSLAVNWRSRLSCNSTSEPLFPLDETVLTRNKRTREVQPPKQKIVPDLQFLLCFNHFSTSCLEFLPRSVHYPTNHKAHTADLPQYEA